MSVVRSRIKTLIIDGRDIGAHEDETILQVARQNGIYIPTLCQLDGLSVVGACRLCLVEVENWKKLVPACATHVEEGLVVNTDSDRIRKYRRMILELLFAEGNHICAVCVSMATVSSRTWLSGWRWIMSVTLTSIRCARWI